MALNRKNVEHVALLARLNLDDAEVDRYTHELNDILEHIDKLKELEVENVEPTSHVIPIQNVFRLDEVSSPLSQSDALANAPDTADGGFRVPRVVEES